MRCTHSEWMAPETPRDRRRIFLCHLTGPADEAGLRGKDSLHTGARRLPPVCFVEGDVQALMSFYNTGRSRAGFEAGIQVALDRILADPEFLFRIENDAPNEAPGTVYHLGDVDLASRLSFFLWEHYSR